MSNISYLLDYQPDAAFFAKLATLPNPKDNYPSILTLNNLTRFSYAPGNVMDGYFDFADKSRALHFLAPPTPAPITSIAYIFAPMVGVIRKVYVAFFYGPAMAMLAETSPITLLFPPVGLRTDSGATYPQVPVIKYAIKGDQAPIHYCITSPSGTGYTISERLNDKGESNLHFTMSYANMPTVEVNPANGITI